MLSLQSNIILKGCAFAPIDEFDRDKVVFTAVVSVPVLKGKVSMFTDVDVQLFKGKVFFFTDVDVQLFKGCSF